MNPRGARPPGTLNGARGTWQRGAMFQDIARFGGIALLLVTSVACKGTTEEDHESISKAMIPEAQQQAKVDDAALEERRKEREAKEAAAKKAEDERKAQLDALTVLPDKLPKDVKKACQAVADANVAFMERAMADDPDALARWQELKASQVSMTIQQCTREGSLEVAACQAAALEKAPPDFKKDIPLIFMHCKDKFGGGGSKRG